MINKDYILKILNTYLPLELCLKIIDYNKYNCYLCNNSNPSNFKFDCNFSSSQVCDNCIYIELSNIY